MLEVEKVLGDFGKAVVRDARKNLTKDGKKTYSDLYRELKVEFEKYPNSFYLRFEAPSYAKFVDEGVRGKNPYKVSPNAKIRGQQAPNSRYRFGSGSHAGTWGQFRTSIERWAKKRNIRFRDDKGRFKKGDYKSLSYVIASNIYNRGIRPSMFFTKAFENHFSKLPDDLIEAYNLDLNNFIDYTFKNTK